MRLAGYVAQRYCGLWVYQVNVRDDYKLKDYAWHGLENSWREASKELNRVKARLRKLPKQKLQAILSEPWWK